MAKNITKQVPIKVNIEVQNDKQFVFQASPLKPGYGHTLGNSLRRVLLSSIEGVALTRVRINDITHEYQTIDGVVEDALDIILNLKQIRSKILNEVDEKVVLNYKFDKGGVVTGKDLNQKGKLEVTNPDQHICTVTKGARFDLELEFQKGYGYLSNEDLDLVKNTNPHDIFVDGVFSPIYNVGIEVEQTRVEDKTDYEKLLLNITTDGTVDPGNVMDYVFETVIDHYDKMRSSLQASLGIKSKSFKKVKKDESLKEESVDEIDLPAKIKNILAKNGINTNSDLKDRIDDVEEFAGIAESSMKKIEEYVESL